jgi:predicted aminopeptidase
MNRLAKILATTTGLLLLAGCGQFGYFAHCTKGHLALLAGRTSIPSLLEDPATPRALRDRLEEVQRIRDFASNSLLLPENGSYRSYADLKRPYATWNVVAAPEFSLAPSQWCFPIAGCVTYRGFFDRELAEKFAARLRMQGLDVYVYGVAAYSTLGWFDDPVLNTFLDQPDPALAGVIFHELAHQRLYVPNDTAFSEAFAMTVELLGVEQWLAAKDPGSPALDYLRAKTREDDFTLLLDDLRDRLAELYRQALPIEEKRRAKQRLLDDFSADYRDWKTRWDDYAGYDRWLEIGLNNAKLASVSTYQRLVPAFRALFALYRSDFATFYRQAEYLGSLPPAERGLELEKLRRIFLASQPDQGLPPVQFTKPPESL